jgi:hypothetical protein
MIRIFESKMAHQLTSYDAHDGCDLHAPARRVASALSIAIACAAAFGCTSTWASGAGTNAQ